MSERLKHAHACREEYSSVFVCMYVLSSEIVMNIDVFFIIIILLSSDQYIGSGHIMHANARRMKDKAKINDKCNSELIVLAFFVYFCLFLLCG